MEKSVSFRLSSYSPLVLAYMGDSYYEMLVRKHIIGEGDCLPAELNVTAKKYVTAQAQSSAFEAVAGLLDETETAVYKMGRNAKSAHSSRSADITDYRRATGLETLFGYYCLSGRAERAEEIFEAICRFTEKGASDNE